MNLPLLSKKVQEFNKMSTRDAHNTQTQPIHDIIAALNDALDNIKNDNGKAFYSKRYTSTSASISLTKNAIIALQDLGVNIPYNKRYISKTSTPRLYQALDDLLVAHSDRFTCKETTV